MRSCCWCDHPVTSASLRIAHGGVEELTYSRGDGRTRTAEHCTRGALALLKGPIKRYRASAASR
jgi:hypothetical protein